MVYMVYDYYEGEIAYIGSSLQEAKKWYDRTSLEVVLLEVEGTKEDVLQGKKCKARLIAKKGQLIEDEEWEEKLDIQMHRGRDGEVLLF